MRWRRRSCRAGPYLGYLQAQKQRLTGERGQKRVHRPELEAMYGFDTKYAMHMLRLGFQGVELLTTGHLSLPMQKPERSFLLDVRRGKVSEEECLVRAGELEQQLPDRFMLSPYYAPGVFCRPPPSVCCPSSGAALGRVVHSHMYMHGLVHDRRYALRLFRRDWRCSIEDGTPDVACEAP